MKINLANLEELVLEKPDLINKLPRKIYDHHQMWLMGKRHPFMKVLAKTAALDALNCLQDEVSLKVLSEYYKQDVKVEGLSYKTIENMKIPISETEICEKIWKINDFSNWFMWRDADYLYISFWR